MRSPHAAASVLVLLVGALTLAPDPARAAPGGDPVHRDDGRSAQAAPPKAPPAPGWIERTPEFLDGVSRAIDRGVAWLRKQQQADGGFGTQSGYPGGLTALGYHTLRTCGVPAGDPACERAYESLRTEYAAAKKAGALRTYSAGLTMLAVADHALTWTPDRDARKNAPARLVDERDRSWMNELVAYLENCQSTDGAWRYGEIQPYDNRRPTDDHDHSNTQYAAQGLRAAALIGCDVKADTWRRLLVHMVEAQQADGPRVRFTPVRKKGETTAAFVAKARGWSYYRLDDPRFAEPSPNPYGSMTAGCVAAATAARSELLARHAMPASFDTKAERAIRDGIGWLGANLSVTENPGRPGWHLYYLYALERAGDLAGVDWLGEHDWYGEGARLLVGAQRDEGTWQGGAPELVDTCFGLLFLRRGTPPAEQGGLTPGGADEPVRFEGAADLEDRDFQDLVDLVVQRWRRAATDRAQEQLATGLASVGPRVVVALFARMASDDADRRRAAYEILVRVTGIDVPFDPEAAPAERERRLADFDAWYVGVAPRLRFDPVRGRLTAR